MLISSTRTLRPSVALLAEGVDRNALFYIQCADYLTSPSSRRAWIEINSKSKLFPAPPVALLAEGVDRNIEALVYKKELLPSPSSRRAWIEITICFNRIMSYQSRPPRGGRG